MRRLNHKNAARLCSLLALGSFLAIIVFGFVSPRPAKETSTPLSSPRGSDRHVMRGIRYSASLNEEIKLSVACDELRVGKKKMGFFRFGLLNEVILTNAKIHIVRTPRKSKEETASRGSTGSSISLEAQAVQQLTKQPGEKKVILLDSARTILNEIGNSKPFPGVSKSRIASLKIAPIDFQVCEADSTLMRISAGRASLELKDRKIVFQDNVTAVIGEESWSGDELMIDVASGSVTSRGD